MIQLWLKSDQKSALKTFLLETISPPIRNNRVIINYNNHDGFPAGLETRKNKNKLTLKINCQGQKLELLLICDLT